MKILRSYVPFLVAYVAGVVFYDQERWVYYLPLLAFACLYSKRAFFYALAMGILFLLGVWIHQYREQETVEIRSTISTYLQQKATVEGVVLNHPVPSRGKYAYVVRTSKIKLDRGDFFQNFQIQITSKSYVAPEKGDIISFQTKIYSPVAPKNFQKVRGIDAYCMIYGDKNWHVIQPANLLSTKVRKKVFEKAQSYLSPVSYGYYRAMVFGDQAMISEQAMKRLKETGLLHLFVISGSHIAFAWGIGLWLLQFSLLWIRPFHRQKNFYVLIEAGSILSVMMFLEIINPPISTFRAVGSMVLFLLLMIMKRNQHALWNLGIVFFVTLLYNPLYLFDISTQLTFASVAGLLFGYHLSGRWTQQANRFKSLIVRASCASLGAGLFTFPILYFHFGTFYALSFAYNLILGTTLGNLVSFLAVASLVWTVVPYAWFQQLMFGILDQLFLVFEKIIFWKPNFGMAYASGLDFIGISGGYVLIGIGSLGMAFIIARRFLKETTEF